MTQSQPMYTGDNGIRFHDSAGTPCSINEVGDGRIWFGPIQDQMIFTRERLATLLPVFEYIVENGELPPAKLEAV